MADHLFKRALSQCLRSHMEARDFSAQVQKWCQDFDGKSPCSTSVSLLLILTLCSSGMAKLWTGKLDQGADLAENQSDKMCDFCYIVWSSFCFFLKAETWTAVMAPLQVQDRTQLTLASSFTLRAVIQMLSHRDFAKGTCKGRWGLWHRRRLRGRGRHSALQCWCPWCCSNTGEHKESWPLLLIQIRFITILPKIQQDFIH